MINYRSAIRNYLLSKTAIATLTGTRIFSGSTLPAGYKPSDGSALLFTPRGGASLYPNTILVPSVQFRAYGGGRELFEMELAADALDRALFDTLSAGRNAVVKAAENEILGQPLIEPETGWPFVLSFYRFHIRN